MAKHHGERQSPSGAAAAGKQRSTMRKKRDFFANSPTGSTAPLNSTSTATAKSPASSPASVSISTSSLTASQPSTPPLCSSTAVNTATSTTSASSAPSVKPIAATATVSSVFDSAQFSHRTSAGSYQSPSGAANGYNPTLAQSGITSGQRSATTRPHKHTSVAKHSGHNKKHHRSTDKQHQVSPQASTFSNSETAANGSPEHTAAKSAIAATGNHNVPHLSSSTASGEVSIFSVAKQVGALNQIRVRRAVPLNSTTAPTSPQPLVAQLSVSPGAAEKSTELANLRGIPSDETDDQVKSVDQNGNTSAVDVLPRDRQQDAQPDKLMQQNFYGYYVDYLLKHAAAASNTSSGASPEKIDGQNPSHGNSKQTAAQTNENRTVQSTGSQQNSELRARLASNSFSCNNHRNLYNLPTRDGNSRPPMPRMPLFARADFCRQKLQHNFAAACSSDEAGSRGGMITYGSILEQALRNGLKCSPASDCNARGGGANSTGMTIGSDSNGSSNAENGIVNHEARGNEATSSRSPASAFDNKNYYQPKASPPSANGSAADLCSVHKTDPAYGEGNSSTTTLNSSNCSQNNGNNIGENSMGLAGMMKKSQSSADLLDHRNSTGYPSSHNDNNGKSLKPGKTNSAADRSGSCSQPPLGILASDEGFVSVQSVVQNVQLASMRSLAHLRTFTKSSTSSASSASSVAHTNELPSASVNQQPHSSRKKRHRNGDSVRLNGSREKLARRTSSADKTQQVQVMTGNETMNASNNARSDNSTSVLPDASLSAPPPTMPSLVSFSCPNASATAGKNPLLNSVAIASWNEEQVGEWLRGLSLLDESAIKAMEDEKLDGSALCLLTEQHLTTHFGLKLGPTLKLRSAIHKLQQNAANTEVENRPEYFNTPSAWFVPPNTPVTGENSSSGFGSSVDQPFDLLAPAATSLASPFPPTNNLLPPASHINATCADNGRSVEHNNNGMPPQHSLMNFNGTNGCAGDNPFSLPAAIFGSQLASSSTIPPEFNNFPFADPAATISALQQQLLACSPLQHLFAAAAAAASSTNANPVPLPFHNKFLPNNAPEIPVPATLSAMLPEHTANHMTAKSSNSAVFKGFNDLSSGFAGNFGRNGFSGTDNNQVNSKTLEN